jgi:hypothetical protein
LFVILWSVQSWLVVLWSKWECDSTWYYLLSESDSYCSCFPKRLPIFKLLLSLFLGFNQMNIITSLFLTSLLTFIFFFYCKYLLSSYLQILFHCSHRKTFVCKGLYFFLFSRCYSAQIINAFVWQESICLVFKLSLYEFSLACFVYKLYVNLLFLNAFFQF